MKIGLLTTYFADYGSYCHASCLYNYLNELGYECELLNACVRYRYSKKLFLANLGYRYLPRKVLEFIAKRNVAFENYIHLTKDLEDIKISKSFRNISELSKKYDCIIVGSDELWSTTLDRQKYIPEYFGIGIECPIISYSTSGISMKNPNETLTEEMVMGLKKFVRIAVRDPITKNWVEKATNREVPVVLDPALLNPFYILSEKVEEKYVLVYGEHFSEQQINKIISYASLNNLQIVSAVWKHEWCNSNLDIESMDVLQEAFHNCNYCVTSTFHGSIFSILHKKNFTAFTSQLRGAKVCYLLKSLGLVERVYEYNPVNCMDNNIDWVKLDETIKELRIFSKDYLKEALDEVERLSSKCQI